MKKFLFLILFATIGINSFAQSVQVNVDYGNNIIFDKNNDIFQGNYYALQYGIRTGDNLFVGVGFGMSTIEDEYTIPIYANFRYYIYPLNNACPYLSVNLGCSEDPDEELRGWNTSFDLGCCMFVGNNTSLNISIGPVLLFLEKGLYGGFQFKIGISI